MIREASFLKGGVKTNEVVNSSGL